MGPLPIRRPPAKDQAVGPSTAQSRFNSFWTYANATGGTSIPMTRTQGGSTIMRCPARACDRRIRLPNPKMAMSEKISMPNMAAIEPSPRNPTAEPSVIN